MSNVLCYFQLVHTSPDAWVASGGSSQAKSLESLYKRLEYWSARALLLVHHLPPAFHIAGFIREKVRTTVFWVCESDSDVSF